MAMDERGPRDDDELQAQGAIEDGDGAADDAPPSRPAPPVGRGSPHWPAKAVRERRITQVFGWLVAGRQRWEIAEDIAALQAKETADRETARLAAVAAGSVTPDADALIAVPLVWGSAPIPIRTQGDYVRRAKDLLIAQSGEFVKQRDEQLALQVARINATYDAATKAGKHYAALKAIELVTELLDLKGHAKQAALEASLAGQATSEQDDAPTLLPTDPESRANAFAQLVGSAIAADPALAAQITDLAPKPSIMP